MTGMWCIALATQFATQRLLRGRPKEDCGSRRCRFLRGRFSTSRIRSGFLKHASATNTRSPSPQEAGYELGVNSECDPCTVCVTHSALPGAAFISVSVTTKFTSQVLPPSAENACSKRHEL